MKTDKLLLIIFFAVLVPGCTGPIKSQLSYPEVKRMDQIDSYNGTEVNDPYQWMENLESADLKVPTFPLPKRL